MPQSKFLRYFPPPKYLASPALGVDISDRSLKFVQLVERGGELRLKRFDKKVVPEGIIQSGEIKNKKALEDFLKASFKGLESSSVILSLPEEKAFVSLVTLPLMPEENIRGALELSLEEHIPLSASQAVFDYTVIGQDETLDHLDLVVVALPKGLAESYSDAVRGAGLMPLAFEMEAEALVRAVLTPDEKETLMVIDFGRTRTSFIIVAGGVVRFTSTVSVAGETLDQTLAKIFKVGVFEAERLKKERGFVKSKENEEVFDALLPVVSAIHDEISRHLIFWAGHLHHLHQTSGEIKKIYLCGGEANLTGLTEYLSYELKLPVKLANPWTNIADFEDYIPEITYRESLSYATALGLALRASNFF